MTKKEIINYLEENKNCGEIEKVFENELLNVALHLYKNDLTWYYRRKRPFNIHLLVVAFELFGNENEFKIIYGIFKGWQFVGLRESAYNILFMLLHNKDFMLKKDILADISTMKRLGFVYEIDVEVELDILGYKTTERKKIIKVSKLGKTKIKEIENIGQEIKSRDIERLRKIRAI